jgi:predicted DsbA family dithiol-disulfide isomerase
MEVEIWSDVACPWCAVGRARFGKALAEFEHGDEVAVRWRSFELDPDAPAEREGEHTANLAAKLGMPLERAREIEAQMTATQEAEGLSYRSDLRRDGSTFDAHRVLHLAADRGVQDAVKARLLEGMQGEGELVSDPEALARLGAEAGLDPAEVREVLAGDAYADAVRADEAAAAQLGIGGVPCFVVDRSMAVSGAQPPEVLLELLRRGWEATHGAAAC